MDTMHSNAFKIFPSPSCLYYNLIDMYTIPYKKKLNQVKHPTIKDVAEKAGVSTTTVLRVLHNNGYVSKETRAKVLEAIDLTGYRYNMVAHNLKKGNTGILGHISFGNYPNPFFARVALGIEKAAGKEGYHVITSYSDGNADKEVQATELLISRQVDGIIFTTPIREENIYKVVTAGIPVVMLERPLDVPIGDYIIVDNFEGAYSAVKYLVSMGHKKIAFIGASSQISTIRNNSVEIGRYEGYRKALFDFEITFDPNIVRFSSDYTVEWGFILGKELLSKVDDFTAIFASSDILAVGVMQALYQRRLRVPEDISIIGFDDSLAIYTSPPLTTVAQPVEELGEEAVKVLLERLIGKVDIPQKKIILHPKLIIRDSVCICKEEISMRSR